MGRSKKNFSFLTLTLAVTLWGCGPSEEEKKAKEKAEWDRKIAEARLRDREELKKLKLTPANFMKINLGMPKGDVFLILGSTSYNDELAPGYWKSTWVEKKWGLERTVWVHFSGKPLRAVDRGHTNLEIKHPGEE